MYGGSSGAQEKREEDEVVVVEGGGVDSVTGSASPAATGKSHGQACRESSDACKAVWQEVADDGEENGAGRTASSQR